MSSRPVTVTRRLEFDAGHTVTGHEGKCRHLHGHRYTAEIVCTASALDAIGRVIDFSAIKTTVGGWIDQNWDHRFLVYAGDPRMVQLVNIDSHSAVVVEYNPTAENMASALLHTTSRLLRPQGIDVLSVTLHETPNGRATAYADDDRQTTLC